jgi:hypothetical protein
LKALSLYARAWKQTGRPSVTLRRGDHFPSFPSIQSQSPRGRDGEPICPRCGDKAREMVRGRRRLTRLPSGRHAASQSVAARPHSPATRQEGHPGRHGGSPPRTPAAPVSTLRTLPAHPSLATPTLRTDTTGRLRLGRLVLGVASRHAPHTARGAARAMLIVPPDRGASRTTPVPSIHPDGRRPGTAVLYQAASGGTDEYAGQVDGGRRGSDGFAGSASYPCTRWHLSPTPTRPEDHPRCSRHPLASPVVACSRRPVASGHGARSAPASISVPVTLDVAPLRNVGTTGSGGA